MKKRKKVWLIEEKSRGTSPSQLISYISIPVDVCIAADVCSCNLLDGRFVFFRIKYLWARKIVQSQEYPNCGPKIKPTNNKEKTENKQKHT